MIISIYQNNSVLNITTLGRRQSKMLILSTKQLTGWRQMAIENTISSDF